MPTANFKSRLFLSFVFLILTFVLWWLPTSTALAKEKNWKDSIRQTLHQSEQIIHKNPEEALRLALQALETNEQPSLKADSKENSYQYIFSYTQVARVYEQMRHYKKALLYYERSLETAMDVNYEDIHLLHGKLAYINEKLDNYREAYHHTLVHNKLKDSLFNIEKNTAIEELQSQYSAHKKQAKIDSLEIEKEYISLKNKEEATFRKIAVIAAIVLLIPTLILLVIYVQKLKSERRLAFIKEEENKHRAAEQERIMELKSIKTSIEAKEEERKRIVAELHDNIAGTLAGIKHSLAKMIKNRDKRNLKKIILSIDSIYQHVRTISHHLALPSMLTTDLTSSLEKYFNDISAINNLEMTVSIFPESHFNSLTKETQREIYRITQECIDNIVKHAKARHVDISFTCHDGNISLMIEDDGVGFDPNCTRSGAGMKNIRSRLELMKGELNIDSIKGRGTVISVIFPVRDFLQVSFS